jgi:hypothetical protein
MIRDCLLRAGFVGGTPHTRRSVVGLPRVGSSDSLSGLKELAPPPRNEGASPAMERRG